MRPEQQKQDLPERSVWIGLLKVAAGPASEALGQAAGAYVHGFAWAEEPVEYQDLVTFALAELGLQLLQLEEVAPLHETSSLYQHDEHVRELADEVRASGQVRFGTFHGFLQEE